MTQENFNAVIVIYGNVVCPVEYPGQYFIKLSLAAAVLFPPLDQWIPPVEFLSTFTPIILIRLWLLPEISIPYF